MWREEYDKTLFESSSLAGLERAFYGIPCQYFNRLKADVGENSTYSQTYVSMASHNGHCINGNNYMCKI